MKKTILSMLTLVLLMLGTAACGLLQEPAAPSATLEAIPLEIDAGADADADPMVEAPAVASPQPAATDEPITADDAYPVATDVPAAADAYPVEDAQAAASATDNDAYPAPANDTAVAARQIFTINPAASLVTFALDEDLRGSRITVLGTTDQVAGQLAVNLADLSQTEVGIIQINARTLTTDNDFRNRAIQNEILETGTYEFITFTPTAVAELPGSAAIGETVTFTISGDLTIRDISQPVTFVVEATAVSDSQISGTATATIAREAFGLTIPEVPSVANVEEEVELTIEFVANAS